MLNFRGPLIKELVQRGKIVYAFAPDYTPESREMVRSIGAIPIDYRLDRTGINPVRDGQDILQLIKLLKQIKPDATLCYFIKPVIYGTLAAQIVGVRHRYSLIAGLGYTFIDNGTQRSFRHKLFQRIILLFYKAAFWSSEKIFFLNKEDIDFFDLNVAMKNKKVIRLPATGVDLMHYSFSAPISDPITFMLAARLLSSKGINEYVESARILKYEYRNLRFILAGGLDTNPDGISKDKILGWVEEGIIEWIGHVSDIRPWLAQTSVYVLPSYREGVPRSTQEAMAMGRPVITTDAVGCKETVEDGRNGYLVPIRNVKALVAAKRKFIENPSLIEKMGKESRIIAEEKFDVKKINKKILEVMGI